MCLELFTMYESKNNGEYKRIRGDKSILLFFFDGLHVLFIENFPLLKLVGLNPLLELAGLNPLS